tara:strand:+ start:344 stop:517 length:174 start_codon:yes stop_codon:yes gene_type:complete
MNITKCKYNAFNPDGRNSSIQMTADGKEYTVPLDPDNKEYVLIQEWVAAGNTIEEAD